MAVNLLDIFSTTVRDELANQASGYVGESIDHVHSAIELIFPSLLAGLMQKGQTADGATAIQDYIHDQAHRGDQLDRLAGLFSGGEQTDRWMTAGSEAISFLGKEEDEIAGMVHSVTGMGHPAAKSLAQMTAPVLLEILGRELDREGLDNQGLSQLLKEQQSYLSAEIPEHILSTLGLPAAPKAKPVPAKTTQTTVEEAEPEAEAPPAKESFLRKLAPWSILITVALVLLAVMQTCGGQPEDVMADAQVRYQRFAAEREAANKGSDASEEPEAPEETVEKPRPTPASALKIRQLPGGLALEATEGSFFDRLIDHLHADQNDPTVKFTLDELRFSGSSADLSPTSVFQLHDLARLMKVYPGLQLRLQWSGEPAPAMQTTADARLSNVKEALMAWGIAGHRIQAATKQTKNQSTPDTIGVANGQMQLDLYVLKK